MLQLRNPARQGPQRRLQHRQCRGGASPSVAGIPRLQAGEDVNLLEYVVDHADLYHRNPEAFRSLQDDLLEALTTS